MNFNCKHLGNFEHLEGIEGTKMKSSDDGVVSDYAQTYVRVRGQRRRHESSRRDPLTSLPQVPSLVVPLQDPQFPDGNVPVGSP